MQCLADIEIQRRIIIQKYSTIYLLNNKKVGYILYKGEKVYFITF